jgi:shikimate kinase
MCAGKTTIARALAARLNCEMLDTDDAIVERERRSIEAIIDEDGEARFRQIETEVLRDCLENSDARIIALGGGTWTLAENRAAIAAHDDCLTIWLDAPFALCWQRIASAQDTQDTRPLAREHDQTLALYTARRQAYSLAEWRVAVSEERSAEDTAVEIASIIERENFRAAEETANMKGRENSNG